MRYGAFFIVLLALGTFNVASADVMGDWQLLGKLQISASVKGKSAVVKHQDLDRISLVFSNDKQFLFSADSFEISGIWTSSKRNFKSPLMPSAANALLKMIEKDLLAKSGLSVLIEADSVSFSGSEQKNGSLKGRLKVKAHTLFLDNGNAAGKFALTYDFTGTRLAANAQ